MTYVYASLFNVIGGPFGPFEETKDEVLFESDNIVARLTSQPDVCYLDFDRAYAVRLIHMDCIVSGEKMTEITDFENRIEVKIELLRKERREGLTGQLVLMIEIKGEVPITNPKIIVDDDKFSFGTQLLSDFDLEKENESKLNAIVSSCIIEAGGACLMKKINKGIYLLQESNKPLYTSRLIPVSSDVFISGTFKNGNKDSIGQRINWLNINKEFDTLSKLITHSCEHNEDSLRSFLFAWSGLEIFYCKVFKLHRDEMLRSFEKNEEIRKRFSDRELPLPEGTQTSVMQRWICVTSYIGVFSEDDTNTFDMVRSVRNDFIHKNAAPEEFPVKETLILFVRCFNGYINFSMDQQNDLSC